MTPTLFIIGSDRKEEEDMLLAEADLAGIPVQFLDAAHLTLILETKEADVWYNGKSIREALRSGRIIFRRTRGQRETVIALALLAKHWNIPATDTPLSIISNYHKMLSMPATTLKNISNIETVFLSAGATFDPQAFGLRLPLLSKPVEGRHGEGVTIMTTQKELESFVAGNTDDVLVQPLLPIDEEFRVFVIGTRSLGVVLKTPAEGSQIANYAAGARFSASKLPARIEQEAIALCAQQGISIGGVDIARVGDAFYLLEINRCPEFKAFTKATGVNVAREIVEYVETW